MPILRFRCFENCICDLCPCWSVSALHVASIFVSEVLENVQEPSVAVPIACMCCVAASEKRVCQIYQTVQFGSLSASGQILLFALLAVPFTGCVHVGEGSQRQAAISFTIADSREHLQQCLLGSFGKTSISSGRESSWEDCNSLSTQSNSRKSRTNGVRSCVCHQA